MIFVTTILLFVAQPLLSTAAPVKENHWVVLVAGSNGFYNYRHQADVCHAYQIFRQHGIPKERIINMMYDDVAYDEENPFPGQLFNNYDYVDVYNNCVIDYRAEMVTPENFVNVLLGNKELKSRGYKVLESNENDTVYIYFTDHGSSGLICFPYDDLYARELNETITQMYEEGRYKEMVLYVEACYSGSMFEEILSDKINVYTTTAANSAESSWATYCSYERVPSCLGDEYSVAWMEDDDAHDLDKWTFKQQYDAVRRKTERSHVSQFGQLNISSEYIAEFAGHHPVLRAKPVTTHRTAQDSVDSEKVKIHTLMQLMQRASNGLSATIVQDKISRTLQLASMAERTFQLIDEVIANRHGELEVGRSKLESLKCHERAVEAYTTGCFRIQQVPEVGKLLEKFWNMCHDGFNSAEIVNAIKHVCN